MILEVQIQSFGARSPAHLKYINIFFENWYEASFYNKEQMQFQNYFIFTPEKVCFWFLKKNTKQIFFLCVSALIQL